MNTFKIPSGRFAAEDAAARMRAKLRDDLLKQKPVNVGVGGNAMPQQNGQMQTPPPLVIPGGKLAAEDAAARMRAKLRDDLLKQKPVNVGVGGNAMPQQNGQMQTPPPLVIPGGKLAAQWYETNPTLLSMEKAAMQRNFPQFRMEKLDDGRICWVGVLEPGIYESKFGQKRQYHIMAVYDNNHPNQQMGSSVRVYPLLPDVDELIQMAGFRPYHLLVDTVGNLYLCTNEAGDQKIGVTTTTAASVLGWACKWLIAFELVLTGEMPLEEFNRHGGI